MTEASNKRYVSWLIFSWSMGIILIALGWIFVQSAKSQDIAYKASERVGSVEGDIKGINQAINGINGKIDIILNRELRQGVVPGVQQAQKTNQ